MLKRIISINSGPHHQVFRVVARVIRTKSRVTSIDSYSVKSKLSNLVLEFFLCGFRYRSEIVINTLLIDARVN